MKKLEDGKTQVRKKGRGKEEGVGWLYSKFREETRVFVKEKVGKFCAFSPFPLMYEQQSRKKIEKKRKEAKEKDVEN